jgi:hypothetical protein
VDDLLNGRPAEAWELAAIEHGRECELDRDLREPGPVPRPVTDVPLGLLP